MLAISDYKSYKQQNIKLINSFKKSCSIVYDRLTDVEKVLDYIVMQFEADVEISEDLEVIFETGFSFFHEQLEQIKLYYFQYFKGITKEFNTFETLINFSLYIDDIKETLIEKKASIETIDKLSNIGKKIEYMLMNKITYSDDDLNDFNIDISSTISQQEKLLTCSEIFALVSEELNL